MIKVLIIDDEPIIREGLRRTIDWRRLQCDVVGEAENGVEALEKIDRLIPDIIITDIMMPGLNGLEVTRYIRENHPNTKIIFLTGYNNFNFAQQAIKLGAFDFVLKPTNSSELENTIASARDQIIRSNAEAYKQEELRKMLETSLPMLKDKFISDLLYSNINRIEEIGKKMQFFGIILESYIIMTVEIDNYTEMEQKLSEEEKFFYMFSVKEKINELLSGCKLKSIISCNQNTFSVILLFGNDESEDMLKSSIISIAEELRNTIENNFPFTVSAGISHYYKDASDIKRAYSEAIICLENRFYIGHNSTIHADDIFNIESCTGKRVIETKPIFDAIRSGNTDKIKIELGNVTGILSHENNKQYVRNVCMEIITGCSRSYCEIYGTMDDIFEGGMIPFERIMGFSAAQDLFNILEAIIGNIIGRINAMQKSQTRKVISKASDYINAHFNEDISLNDVAGHVFMSPWYFSKLFKKEAGETFSEFLLMKRIEKAKEFLKNNIELKTYEIAEKIGFNDSRYFGQIFKKVTGMTPMEYRESG